MEWISIDKQEPNISDIYDIWVIYDDGTPERYTNMIYMGKEERFGIGETRWEFSSFNDTSGLSLTATHFLKITEPK
jgi:hypothetical protein